MLPVIECFYIFGKNALPMKKLLPRFIILSIMLAFTGCSDDDNVPATGHLNVGQSLVGKWSIEGGTINGGDFENYIHECAASKDYQEFTAEGIVRYAGHGQDCEVNDTQDSSYSVTGNILTVQDENDPAANVFTIVSVTSEDMILERTVNTPGGTQTQRSYFTRI